MRYLSDENKTSETEFNLHTLNHFSPIMLRLCYNASKQLSALVSLVKGGGPYIFSIISLAYQSIGYILCNHWFKKQISEFIYYITSTFYMKLFCNFILPDQLVRDKNIHNIAGLEQVCTHDAELLFNILRCLFPTRHLQKINQYGNTTII